MCIICVKPLDVDMPKSATLSTMWQANSDGAGLAYVRQGENVVRIVKGFMKLKKLKKALHDLQLGKGDLVVLHFRWATHGLTDEGNCHPFPLSNKPNLLRAVSGEFPCAIAHNGVFGNMACHETLSDTQKFIAKVLANSAIIDNIDNPAVKELITGYCGHSSKLAILKPSGVTIIGEFEADEATGLLYSNDGYMPVKTYNYGNWHNAADEKPVDDAARVEHVLKAFRHASQMPHECELCGACEDDDNKQEIDYVPEFDLFLCESCFQYNAPYLQSPVSVQDANIAPAPHDVAHG